MKKVLLLVLFAAFTMTACKSPTQRAIEDYNKAQQEQQASAQQVTNAQQKADVSADSYLRADVKRNTGNLTAGHSSGALTAKKTLQGFGGNDEDLQAKEQWY